MSLRPSPRVVKLSTWVSPRSNRPEPWAVGITPTWLDTGRSWSAARPSMRTPSATMRRRTTSLVTAFTAAPILSAVSDSLPNRSARAATVSADTAASAAERSALSAICWVSAMRASASDRTASSSSSV